METWSYSARNYKMKNCSKCKISKDEACFNKSRSKNDGFNSHCKECVSKQNKIWRENNKEIAKTKNKDWNNRNKAYTKEYKKINKERDSAKKAEWYQRTKILADQEKIDRKNRNREKWMNSRDLDKYRQSRRVYINSRLKNDESFRILTRLRACLSQAISRNKNGKKAATEHLIGCSFKELKTHLESKFQPGMTWDNHSRTGWHIDHILPVSSFVLSTLEGQKACNHYTNLQPLWAKDNLRKGNRIAVNVCDTIDLEFDGRDQNLNN
jgi:hypothetical protein